MRKLNCLLTIVILLSGAALAQSKEVLHIATDAERRNEAAIPAIPSIIPVQVTYEGLAYWNSADQAAIQRLINNGLHQILDSGAMPGFKVATTRDHWVLSIVIVPGGWGGFDNGKAVFGEPAVSISSYVRIIKDGTAYAAIDMLRGKTLSAQPYQAWKTYSLYDSIGTPLPLPAPLVVIDYLTQISKKLSTTQGQYWLTQSLKFTQQQLDEQVAAEKQATKLEAEPRSTLP
jgi:hypothetical protein